MRIRRNLSFAAALILGAGAAYAADVPNFNQMDKDNDGALTTSEAAANPKLADQFARVDDDGDGRLSRFEYLQIMGRQDLHNLRGSIAEFIDPDDKAPLAAGGQASAQQRGGGQASASTGAQQQGPQAPAMAASSQLIRNVQQQLQAKGIDAGPVDGIWGPQTHQGLTDFQQAQGLEASGQLNGPTLAALGIAGQQSASAGNSASAGQSASGGSSASAGSGLPSFQRADKNNDGNVSREEFEAAMDKTR